MESRRSAKPAWGGCSVCSQLLKVVVGRQVAVDLARTVVDLLLYLMEPFLSNGAEVISFGEIFPDQPVVVLYAVFLPRMVGFAEVALASQQLVDQDVPRELKSVVIGDAPDFHSQQKAHGALEGSIAALVGHQVKPSHAALAFVERHQETASVAALDEVRLPIPEPLPVSDDRGSQVDVNPVRNFLPATGLAAPSIASFAVDPEV